MKALVQLCLLLALLSCAPSERRERPVALVSVPPYAWIVEALMPGHYEVEVLVPPAASPVTHEPTPTQLQRARRAELWIAVGHRSFPFDRRWRDTLRELTDELAIVTTSDGEGGDPHIWVDPRSMRSTVESVAAYLQDRHPDRSREIAERRDEAIARIVRLDLEVSTSLEAARGKRFVVFHPAWAHLTERFGIRQLSIEHDHKSPSAHDLADLIAAAREAGIDTLFVQPQFDRTAAEALAEQIDASVEPLDPLEADWFEMVRGAAEAIARAAR